MSIGKMRIYGCGGAGVNIASRFQKASEEPGCATPQPVYLDTSRSNLTPDIAEEQCFIIQGVDGSGKIRRENHQEIGQSIRQILLKHKPLDFNVVVFSASGGSGSVFGPLLVGELLSRGEPTVAIVIGSDESAITANNTLNTLKSLESISRKNDVPVVMHYSQNRRGCRRSDVDGEVAYVIATLAVLCSRQNVELDSRDLVNWLQYQKTTTVPAQLSVLAVAQEEKDLLDSISQPISIASVFSDKDQIGLNIVPDYHCAGYSDSPLVGESAIHFAIGVDEVPLIARDIKETLSQLSEVRESRVNRNSLVDGKDSVDDDGMVFD